jgi:hypothetical protein
MHVEHAVANVGHFIPVAFCLRLNGNSGRLCVENLHTQFGVSLIGGEESRGVVHDQSLLAVTSKEMQHPHQATEWVWWPELAETRSGSILSPISIVGRPMALELGIADFIWQSGASGWSFTQSHFWTSEEAAISSTTFWPLALPKKAAIQLVDSSI